MESEMINGPLVEWYMNKWCIRDYIALCESMYEEWEGPEWKLLWPVPKTNIAFAQNWRTLNHDFWYLICISSLYILDILPCLLLIVLILGIWWSRGKTLGSHSEGLESDSKSALYGDFSEHRSKPSLLEIVWKIQAPVPPLLGTMLICPNIHSYDCSLAWGIGVWPWVPTHKWILNPSLGGQRPDRLTQTVSGGTR